MIRRCIGGGDGMSWLYSWSSGLESCRQRSQKVMDGEFSMFFAICHILLLAVANIIRRAHHSAESSSVTLQFLLHNGNRFQRLAAVLACLERSEIIVITAQEPCSRLRPLQFVFGFPRVTAFEAKEVANGVGCSGSARSQDGACWTHHRWVGLEVRRRRFKDIPMLDRRPSEQLTRSGGLEEPSPAAGLLLIVATRCDYDWRTCFKFTVGTSTGAWRHLGLAPPCLLPTPCQTQWPGRHLRH
jgi:hypothetical protein